MKFAGAGTVLAGRQIAVLVVAVIDLVGRGRRRRAAHLGEDGYRDAVQRVVGQGLHLALAVGDGLVLASLAKTRSGLCLELGRASTPASESFVCEIPVPSLRLHRGGALCQS